MIRIISKVDGFRRGGIEHSAQPVEYPDDAFTAEQLAVLQAEPMLLVDLLPDAPQGATGGLLPDGPLRLVGEGLGQSSEGSQRTTVDLDDLNSAELVELAQKETGVALDPKADWFVLRADVEVLLRAKASAESGDSEKEA